MTLLEPDCHVINFISKSLTKKKKKKISAEIE